MSREIKFKFWLGHIGKMTYAHTLAQTPGIIKEFTPDIVPLQFTGLLDKNGREIYEGDILLCGMGGFEIAAPIEFAEHGFWIKDNEGNNHLPYNREVIGNIYENPKLL